MTARFLAASLGVVLALGLAGFVTAQDEAKSQPAPSKEKAPQGSAKSDAPKRKPKGAAKGKSSDDSAAKGKLEKATFGGGCFWCLEAVFERVKGVKSVVSGFAGGTVPRPSYEMVCTGLTGHAEVVQIDYDPEVVSYDKLLEIFFECHDPTTLNRQGPDEGTQYRSIILYHNDAQKKAARQMYEELTEAHAFADPIVTQLVPLTKFYPAEKYHQNYYRRHRYDDYSMTVIAPKLEMMRIKAERAKQAR
jgi:peptide-methionine (S)-S-oxide reductase